MQRSWSRLESHVPEPNFSRFYVLGILLATLCYQAVLCFLNTKGLRASTAIVGVSEVLIYAACIPILVRPIWPQAVLVLVVVVANVFLLSLVRQGLDFKAIRDMLIPIFFIWLGRNVGTLEIAERILKIAICIVLVFGLFELLAVDLYTRLFDIFSYYASQGSVAESSAMYVGQKLQLNGFRPEGIGRTLLPALLGNHRISSIFLEPVSFGNFAVLLAAWGLAKPREELRSMLFYLGCAMIFITLADSRFGLGMIFILMFLRWAMDGKLNINTAIACLVPVAVVMGLIALGAFYAKLSEDSLLGRLTWTGVTLLNFGTDLILGTQAPLPNFGDMGYAYLCSRFGLPLCIFLWVSFVMVKNTTEMGMRFRAYLAIYVSLILSVSGTSLFALKTAGLVWFLFGTLSALSETQKAPSLRLHSLQPA